MSALCMAFLSTSRNSSDAHVRAWLSRLPLARRMSARLGLHGKLILCFMLLLTLALATSCWVFAHQSATQLTDIMGEQARQISSALVLTCQDEIQSGNLTQLASLAQNLIKSRNIMFAGFLDNDFKPIAFASRDPDFRCEN